MIDYSVELSKKYIDLLYKTIKSLRPKFFAPNDVQPLLDLSTSEGQNVAVRVGGCTVHIPDTYI